MSDLVSASQEVEITNQDTGIKCVPDANGNLPVLAGQTGTWDVGGRHAIFATETYTTTNVDATARPVNGNLDTQHMASKSIVVSNTGANSARINVKASVDSTPNFGVFLSTNTLLASGNTLVVTNTDAHTYVQILARSSVAGQSTTIVTKAYAKGT